MAILGGTFAIDGLTVTRMGYGAMQLAGPHVFGPPRDRGAAVAVLREASCSASTTSIPAIITAPTLPTKLFAKRSIRIPKTCISLRKSARAATLKVNGCPRYRGTSYVRP